MLWYKNWLETRWVFVVASVFSLLPLVFNQEAGRSLPEVEKLLPQIGLYWIFAGALLAGAGIRTRSGLRNKGLSGSMYYLLSMPASRIRLYLARVSLGFLEFAGTIAVTCVSVWFALPVLRASTDASTMARYGLEALACASAYYFLGVLAASLIDDEIGKIMAVIAVAGILVWMARRTGVSPSLDLARAVVSASPLRPSLPSTSLWFSAGLSAALGLVALKVVQQREYSA